MSDERDPRGIVHEAIGAYLDEGELPVRWVLTVDVVGTNGTRYLAHRSGGGADGQDSPMAWEALGMLEAARDVAVEALRDWTSVVETEDDEDEEGDSE